MFKVKCAKCSWRGYSDQCDVVGEERALYCPDCEAFVVPVFRKTDDAPEE